MRPKGFLHGGSATATVTAKTATSALVIDDSTVASLEKHQPPLAVQILRQLASIAEERMSDNLVLDSTAKAFRLPFEAKPFPVHAVWGWAADLHRCIVRHD
jgi:hypothetical protein